MIRGLYSIMLIGNAGADHQHQKMDIKQLNFFGNIHSYNDSSEALEYLRKIKGGKAKNLIQMPHIILYDEDSEMTGLEFITEFSKIGFNNSKRPVIIILSSMADKKMIEASIDKGCSAYIKKPFTAAKLLELLWF